MQPCHFNFLICRFELFCRTVFPQDSYFTFTSLGGLHLLSTTPYCEIYLANLLIPQVIVRKFGFINQNCEPANNTLREKE